MFSTKINNVSAEENIENYYYSQLDNGLAKDFYSAIDAMNVGNILKSGSSYDLVEHKILSEKVYIPLG